LITWLEGEDLGMDPLHDWPFPGCTHTFELPQARWWREKKLDLDPAAAQLLEDALKANEVSYPVPWIDHEGETLVLDLRSLEDVQNRNPHLEPPDCLSIPHPSQADEYISVALWQGRGDVEGDRPFWVLDYLPRPPEAFTLQDYKRIADHQVIADKYDEQLSSG
jgi:hypothetical protein